MRSFRRLVVTAAAATLALAGCSDPVPVAEEPTGDEERTVHLYGTDGTMQNSFAAEFADQTLLRGMKGTAPLNQMPTEFTNRLREVDPDLTDFLFAGETYDAVAISALAAELAGTPNPEVVRDYITTVTTGGEPCDTVADCLELAADGEDLAYQGVSLRRGGLTDLGQPATASYATLHFGADGLLDDAKTEFVGSGDPSETTTAKPPEPGPRPTAPGLQIEPLTFGGLLPETGDLSIAYPPMIAGARLAVAEINDAGGVFGVDVEWVDGDTETSPKVAGEVLASHIEDGVHVIIGPAASSEAEAIMADAAAAKRIMFSPSNTEASLSNADHDGYYFRTAPSDELQGAALADIMLRDGVARVTIVARDDAYGRGLQANARDSLLGFGVPTADIALLTYGVPEEDGAPVPGLARLVDEIIASRPDGVLVIGFSEAAQVIERMADQGLRPTP
ncbi:MAG: ABC transporter substrate-binding protein [Micromonosporaceae bacterium]|nr:ABC transporter substrate-binding protein [Micromonosporaceae bacterium]